MDLEEVLFLGRGPGPERVCVGSLNFLQARFHNTDPGVWRACLVKPGQ